VEPVAKGLESSGRNKNGKGVSRRGHEGSAETANSSAVRYTIIFSSKFHDRGCAIGVLNASIGNSFCPGNGGALHEP